jgi:GNAT superfamily N-acetyltransferase
LEKNAFVRTISSRRLENADAETTAALGALLPQVSSRAPSLTPERLEAVLSSPGTSIVVASLDGRIVGMALLCVCETLAGRFGVVEEVAVDQAARGHHVGIELMVTVLEEAECLVSTSSNSRHVQRGRPPTGCTSRSASRPGRRTFTAIDWTRCPLDGECTKGGSGGDFRHEPHLGPVGAARAT